MLKLKDIATVQAGYPFRSSIKEIAKGEAYVVQVRHQNQAGEIAWHELMRTNLPGKKKPDWLEEGNILFLARGPRNKATAVPKLNIKVVSAPHFYVVKIAQNKGSVLPEFIAWQLNQPPAQRYIAASAEGSAQTNIRRAVLENTPIAMPSLEKQQKIMQLVETAKQEQQVLNQLIENRERQLAALANDIFKQ